jgi:energy-coupling factor transport system ATP-binding protein
MTGHVSKLPGRNFSGRSHALRRFTGFGTTGSIIPTNRHFIGLDSANFLTGLSPSVAGEMIIHGGEHWRDVTGIEAILDCCGLEHLMNRNPYTLSGGEQTLVALAGALAAKPSALAIDSTLEQLNPATRERLLNILLNECGWCEKIVISDNRFDEYPTNISLPLEHSIELRPDNNKKQIDSLVYRPYTTDKTYVELKQLTYHYPGEANVLKGIDLTLEPGHIYLLKGLNGAGKTTLSKILAGIYRPTNGEIIVNSHLVPEGLEAGSLFAYHFQEPALQLFSTSVQKEVLSSALADDAVTQMLHAFGLIGLESVHPLDLPFTLRKRLALAATFSMQRPWIILDEPTLGQDNNNLHAIVDIISKQADSGTGVIVISHSLRLMEILGGEVIKLNDGVVSR